VASGQWPGERFVGQLDVGGGATADAVKKAFELLLSSKDVKSIFVNICKSNLFSFVSLRDQDKDAADRIVGGIMRCDVIAEGIIKATKELDLSIPLVVRFQGTKEAEAKKWVHPTFPVKNTADPYRMIKESGLKIYPFDGLDEAAAKAVEMAK
jgi:succinyl-CoA synthetase beta subunit